jgi:hypothetical protein
MTRLTIFIAFLALTNFAMAQYTPFIDEDEAKHEVARDKEQDIKCLNVKPFGALMKCIKDFDVEWHEKYPRRGNDRYCERHYRDLTVGEAKAKVSELYRNAEHARGFMIGNGELPGEVSRDVLKGEALWIRVNVLGEKLLDTTMH